MVQQTAPRRPYLQITVGSVVKQILSLLSIFFVVSPSPAQWTRVEGLPAGESYAVFVANDTIYASIYNMVFYSNDQWSSVQNFTPLNDSVDPITAMVKRPSSFIVGTLSQGVFETFDRHLWIPRYEGLSGLGASSISALVLRDSLIYAGTYGAGVFRAPASFATAWSQFNAGIPSNLGWNINSLTNLNDTLWAGGGANAMVYRNVPQESTWQELPFATFSPLGTSFLAAATYRTSMHAIGSQGLHRTTDGGTTWTEFDPGAGYIATGGFVHTPYGLYAFLGKATSTYLLRLSEDDSSWVQVALEPGQTFAMALSGNTLFAARLDGLWKYELEPTAVGGDALEMSPETMLLQQNYPNPFNPTTRITYQVPSPPGQGGGNLGAERVRLVVYDLLGREVAVLVDEAQQPGTYQVTFDGANLSAGTYMYRLTAGSRAESQRMLLVK